MRKEMNELIKRKELVRFVLTFVFAIIISAFASVAFAQGQFCYSGVACRGGDICETETCIDFSGNVNVKFVNCNSCGITTAICRDGGVATCQNTCQETTFGSTCTPCNALNMCGAQSTGKPTAVVFLTTFDVTALELSIAPQKAEFPFPVPVAYQVTVKNTLPADILLDVAGAFPTGWTAQLPAQIALKAGETKTFPVSLNPDIFAAQGTYNIAIAVVNTKLKLVQLASTLYVISEANAPSIKIMPESFTGTPTQVAAYTITITNNDPETFPPRIISINVGAPAGWQMRISTRTLSLNGGESADVMLEVLPNLTADAGAHQIAINITSGEFQTTRFATYIVTLCGDNICHVGEEESCPADCPVTAIKCNPRCESEIDWGVSYNAVIDTLTTKFVVCAYGATPAACEAAYNSNNCGLGKPCLCGSPLSTSCTVRCVDAKGAYYMIARSVGETLQSANYSFTCPFVNLKEIIELRDSFIKSRIEFEKSQAAIQEVLARTVNVTERAKYQPCLQGLDLIIDNVTSYTKFLDGVIAFPGKQNTTQARNLAADIKGFIESTFATYCKTTLGILKIEDFDPPEQVQIGQSASARVTVKNIGNVNYYGYVECDFISPLNRISQQRTSCTPVPQETTQFFTLNQLVNDSGTWRLRCRVIGSLRSDCSSEVHDETSLTAFNTYTKEIFVRDVIATATTDRISCTVRTNRPGQCVGCRVGGSECVKISSANDTTNFECKLQSGILSVAGYVYDTADCVTIEPKNKTASIKIPGCGDEFLDNKTEQCEPPGKPNPVCKQDSFTCSGKRYGTRGTQGFCGAQCKCEVREEFIYKCVADKCGAECSEGDVQQLEDGCVMKCSNSCTFVKDCSGKQSFVFDPEITSGTVRPGESLFYQAVMKNTGSLQDDYTFTLTGNGVVLVSGRETTTLTLNAEEQRNVVFKVTPNKTEQGSEEIALLEIQSSKNGKRSVEYRTVTSQVTNIPPVISNILASPASVKLGETITFTADITDPDRDSITSALVCGDRGCSTVFCRLVLSGTVGTCVYTTDRTGEIEYFLQVKDARDGFSISSGRTFNVDASEPIGGYPGPVQVENKEGSVIWNVVLIALAIVIMALAWFFRDEIKDRVERFKIWWQYRFG